MSLGVLVFIGAVGPATLLERRTRSTGVNPPSDQAAATHRGYSVLGDSSSMSVVAVGRASSLSIGMGFPDTSLTP